MIFSSILTGTTGTLAALKGIQKQLSDGMYNITLNVITRLQEEAAEKSPFQYGHLRANIKMAIYRKGKKKIPIIPALDGVSTMGLKSFLAGADPVRAAVYNDIVYAHRQDVEHKTQKGYLSKTGKKYQREFALRLNNLIDEVGR